MITIVLSLLAPRSVVQYTYNNNEREQNEHPNEDDCFLEEARRNC
jgi:hypothetical protein